MILVVFMVASECERERESSNQASDGVQRHFFLVGGRMVGGSGRDGRRGFL